MFRHHLIVRKCTHSVYRLCGASELSQRVIEIPLSELDGDGEVGCSVCDSQWGEKEPLYILGAKLQLSSVWN